MSSQAHYTAFDLGKRSSVALFRSRLVPGVGCAQRCQTASRTAALTAMTRRAQAPYGWVSWDQSVARCGRWLAKG